MAEGDDQRVESRMQAIGRGFSATPEKIEALRQKAERLERANRGPPARAFGAVLGDKRGPASEAEDDESQEPERQVGPRPALSHPRQREQFGLDKKKTTVILKG